MERIRLSKREKQVLRLLHSGFENCPDTYPRYIFAACVSSLERKGLVRAAWASGHEPATAELTDFGMAYLAENPALINPVNWSVIFFIVAIVFGIMAILVSNYKF